MSNNKSSNDSDKPSNHQMEKAKISFGRANLRKKKQPGGEESGKTEAVKLSPGESSQAALSEKMAKISSMRESSVPHDNHANESDDPKSSSTLPKTMARVSRLRKESEIKERLVQGKVTASKTTDSPDESDLFRMDDPEPGFFTSFIWFVFSFGRFARSVLLVQSPQNIFLFFLIAALGSIQCTMSFLSPVAGAGPVYNTAFTSQVVAGGMLLGVGFYLMLSLLLHFAVNKVFGGIGRLFGLKILVNAFLPLAVFQIAAMIYGTILIGEAYWRGNVPVGYEVFTLWILPAMWIWGGYRIAQVFTGVFTLRRPAKIGVKLGLPLFAAFTFGAALKSVDVFFRQDFRNDWEVFEQDVQSQGTFLTIERFDQMEKRIPFHDIRKKRDLYLYRMQALFRLDEYSTARADALRLDRMSLPDSAYDRLAKGLNFLFQDHLDLAASEFSSAIERDPLCLPAHQWLTLLNAGSDIQKAEKHARILMDADPNVSHFRLLVRILFAQEKHQQIWNLMLEVDAAPDQWDPLTLEQGGVSAGKVGKIQRSEMLLELSKEKSSETSAQIDGI